jgi:beta-galactosidase
VNVASARRRIKFDYDWLFTKSDREGAEAGEFDDSEWRALHLPHDWVIEEEPRADLHRSNGFFPGGVCWYRKRFKVPAMPDGGRVSVEFDGVYHNSDVWLNGVHLGGRPYGYVTFRYDLTPHLRHGENVIAVRVDTSVCPTSRWYSGSGIYRHVWLDVTDALHVAQWGTYVTTPRIGPGSADVRVRTTVRNDGDAPETCTLVTKVIAPSDAEVATAEARSEIAPGEGFDFEQTLEAPAPELWSIVAPRLYTVRSIVKTGGAVRDTYETGFGIREAKFDSARGFLLNGEPVKMKGVCNHHDAGCLGAAVPERALERRLETLRGLGCNAIRTSHNPPAPELLDLTDRMGFLVIDECFDKWRGGYYKEHFDEWWQRDVDAMVRRDRNHPSVVLWSVGNEVGEQFSAEGAAVARMLVEYVHEHEPSRPVTTALIPQDGASRNINDTGFAAALDVVAYNYQEAWYASDKALYPDRIVLGTECYPHFNRRSTEHVDFTTRNPWGTSGI